MVGNDQRPHQKASVCQEWAASRGWEHQKSGINMQRNVCPLHRAHVWPLRRVGRRTRGDTYQAYLGKTAALLHRAAVGRRDGGAWPLMGDPNAGASRRMTPSSRLGQKKTTSWATMCPWELAGKLP